MSNPQLDELTREIILDHYRRPRNRGALESPQLHAHGMNPVCGDEIEIDLTLGDGHITGIAFRGQGCSISQSSASMMTEGVRGLELADAHRLYESFRGMLMTGEVPSEPLGDLEALEGVAQFPVRVKCALLCWTVLQNALERQGKAA